MTEHFSALSISATVEILCILEYTLLRRKRLNREDDSFKTTLESYFHYLNLIREKGSLEEELQRAGLLTSLDRIRLGMKLAL